MNSFVKDGGNVLYQKRNQLGINGHDFHDLYRSYFFFEFEISHNFFLKLKPWATFKNSAMPFRTQEKGGTMS